MNVTNQSECNSIEFLLNTNGHQHSILVGKKCAYCMECGQILIEYKDKKHFYKLMNPIDVTLEVG